jgi:hypothetical protein
MPDDPLTSAFHAQLILVNGIRAEIADLMGTRQSQDFIQEVLGGIPTISSLLEFQQIISAINQQAVRSIQSYQISSLQMKFLHQRYQTLAAQYLGKEYAPGVVKILFKQLPPPLKQSLAQWFESL